MSTKETRLLTPEERQAISDAMLANATYGAVLKKVAQEQDTKTRRETLKELREKGRLDTRRMDIDSCLVIPIKVIEEMEKQQ